MVEQPHLFLPLAKDQFSLAKVTLSLQTAQLLKMSFEISISTEADKRFQYVLNEELIKTKKNILDITHSTGTFAYDVPLIAGILPL